MCLQGVWGASIVHQSNSEAHKFWENRLHYLFECTAFTLCITQPERKYLQRSVRLVYFILIQQTERNCTEYPQDASHSVHRERREVCASPRREQKFIDNKKINSVAGRKWISRV